MFATRTSKTLADYVAIAISPVLIMALVGSLVFFLVAVLYVGDFAGRLCWILFFFVFGAVLIARMTMGEEADRAGLYGLVLGLLTWIALLIYVDWKDSGGLAPFGWLIDIGLIAIIWWCAHRLTWDCTLIDDDVDASGVGLLQVAGLEGKAQPTPDDTVKQPADKGGKRDAEPLTALSGWIDRYRRYKDERNKRPHTPGVWVVYFSLAALPLFGLGQALLSANSARASAGLSNARQYTFWLMTIYVGSGLGLLLTTSFLGLRRYLRQRKLQMPVAMTGVWLTVGAMLIAAFLFVGAILPRPDSAQPLVEWVAALTSPDRDASDHDQLGDEAGEGEGREGNQQPKDKAQEKDGSGRDKGDAKDQKPDKDGKASGKEGQGNKKDGGSSKKDGKGKDGNDSKQERQKDGKSDRDKNDVKEKGNDNAPKDKEEKSKKDGSGRRQARQTPPSHPPANAPDFLKPIANILKWVVAGIVAAVVLFLLLKNGLKFLANFTVWARNLLASLQAAWQALLAWLRGQPRGSEDGETSDDNEQTEPFAVFPDPFQSGAAERMTSEKLVRYSFDAFQAWARERDLARQPGETPLEFARRLGEEVPALDLHGRKLANFYAQIAYARGSLNKSCREPLRQFWQVLGEAVENPMSAGIGGQ